MDGDILENDGGRGGRPVLSLLSRMEAEEEAGADGAPTDATLSNEWYCVKETPPAIDDDAIDKSSLSAIIAVEYVSYCVGSDDDMLDSFVFGPHHRIQHPRHIDLMEKCVPNSNPEYYQKEASHIVQFVCQTFDTSCRRWQ